MDGWNKMLGIDGYSDQEEVRSRQRAGLSAAIGMDGWMDGWMDGCKVGK
jgi:hypothetical protein